MVSETTIRYNFWWVIQQWLLCFLSLTIKLFIPICQILQLLHGTLFSCSFYFVLSLLLLLIGHRIFWLIDRFLFFIFRILYHVASATNSSWYYLILFSSMGKKNRSLVVTILLIISWSLVNVIFSTMEKKKKEELLL